MQGFFFVGAAYAHEAMLLGAARDLREETYEAIAAIEKDTTSVSALRARWSRNP